MVAGGTAPVILELTTMPAGYFGQTPILPPGTVPAPVSSPVLPPGSQQLAAQPVSPAVYPSLPVQSSPAPVEPRSAASLYRPGLPVGAAEIKPALPLPGNGKVYRVQVGSYQIARNAVEAVDKLKAVGLNPGYEKNGDLYRVVLSGIRSEDVPAVAERLGAAGFREALIREEPR